MPVSRKKGKVYVGDRSLRFQNTVGITGIKVRNPAQGQERRG